MNGIFAIRKPVGPTSQDCVSKLKHLFTNSPYFVKDVNKKKKHQYIKIGHGGTLDPLADGVLVIGVGTGTKKLQQYLGNCEKVYTATCMFGCSTTTYDSEGSVLGWSGVDITDEQIAKALEKFRGKIQQVPPVFSALKMDGIPLYEYARSGKPLPRAIEARECEISSLEATPLRYKHEFKFPETVASENEIKFAHAVTGEDLSGGTPLETGPCIDLKFTVSSGTYIRSLVHDLARELGVQAHMVRLTRDRQAEWVLGENTLDLELFDGEWYPTLLEVLGEGASWRPAPSAAPSTGQPDTKHELKSEVKGNADLEPSESQSKKPKLE